MKKNGFTLIELLAVIIILGILMIIAIPSVTRYISDSRKNAYVDTAKELISGARNLVNEGRLEMYDTDVTYYIGVACIKTENASKSPYGDFTNAYVVVTYDGKGYSYYWTSVDDAGQGVKNITPIDKLDTDSIESDLKNNDIINSLGVNGRHKYMVIDESTNCNKGTTENVTDYVSGEGETSTNGGAVTTIISNANSQLSNITDTNIYIFSGRDPNNYVSFNNETWRIIGMYGNQIKLIRTSSIGNYKYDEDNSSNGWENSDLNAYLNGDYYNSLNSTSKNLVSNGAWYAFDVGNAQTGESAFNRLKERPTYDAKVGLLSTPEYLYAGNVSCHNQTGSEYSSECASNNWTFMNNTSNTWLIHPNGISATSIAYYISTEGRIKSYFMKNLTAVYPAVFLDSTVKIASGDGTINNKYVFKK